MKEIRVLQVLTSMDRGGAETMVMNYYRAIDRTKVQFDFLLHRDEKGAYEEEITAMGGKIFRMPPLGPKQYFKYLKKLALFFDDHPEYQIVHSHMNAYSYWVLKMAKQKNVGVRIAHSHTSIEPIFKKIILKNTDLKTTFKDAVQSFLRYGVRNVASHYFTCGQKAGRWLFGRHNGERAVIINNAVNSRRFAYNPKKAKEVANNLGLRGKVVIGHVGNFVEAKNHAFLIKVFDSLLKQRDNTVLVLVGHGYLKEKIREQALKLGIGSKVHFLGVRNDIPDLMQLFDIFLFPSLYEGLPMTLIEAQAAGLKIIASKSISDEVDVTGLIEFHDLNKDEDYWAEIILKNLSYNRANTHDKMVTANYDIENNAEKLLQFYCNT